MSKFKPHGVYIMVSIPKEYWEKNKLVAIDEKSTEELRKAYLNKGDKLVVEDIGDDAKFVKPGDTVSINSRGFVSVKVDGIPEPMYLIRESEVLGKFL